MLRLKQKQWLQHFAHEAVSFDVSMAGYSTFKTGGRAAALVDVGTKRQLLALMQFVRQEHLPWRVIGRGSNILISDLGFAGVLFRLQGSFREIVPREDIGEGVRIEVGAGCLLAQLLGWCQKRGLAGLEFLAGIPGGVGGAIRMNAGAFTQSIGERLHALFLVGEEGIPFELAAGDLDFGYRKMHIAGRDMERIVVLAADFNLQREESEKIEARMRKNLLQRKEKQPVNLPSAGSFFRNPEGDFAGRLIEEAGLKGLRIGGAMVSPVHANFIVNAGEATASDIIQVMRTVQEKVEAEAGIFLEPEVHIF